MTIEQLLNEVTILREVAAKQINILIKIYEHGKVTYQGEVQSYESIIAEECLNEINNLMKDIPMEAEATND